MTRACTICAHPALAAINKALAAGESPTALAARYSTIGRMALERHTDNHLPKSVVKAQETEDVRQALDVLVQLKAINSASQQILADARRQGDPETALKAIDRIHKQIELQAKLLGELDDRPVVNLLVLPEWLRVRGTLLSALAPYPEARTAVASALARLEADSG